MYSKTRIFRKQRALLARVFLKSRNIQQRKTVVDLLDFASHASCGTYLEDHHCATIPNTQWWRSNLWHGPVTSDGDLLGTSHRYDLSNLPLLISGIFDINGFPTMSRLIGSPK